jgi:hypothetical protein
VPHMMSNAKQGCTNGNLAVRGRARMRVQTRRQGFRPQHFIAMYNCMWTCKDQGAIPYPASSGGKLENNDILSFLGSKPHGLFSCCNRGLQGQHKDW